MKHTVLATKFNHASPSIGHIEQIHPHNEVHHQQVTPHAQDPNIPIQDNGLSQVCHQALLAPLPPSPNPRDPVQDSPLTQPREEKEVYSTCPVVRQYVQHSSINSQQFVVPKTKFEEATQSPNLKNCFEGFPPKLKWRGAGIKYKGGTKQESEPQKKTNFKGKSDIVKNRNKLKKSQNWGVIPKIQK